MIVPYNPTEVSRLLELRRKATPGPWQFQTGCSWRRFGTPHAARSDGTVICPTVHPQDNHPDLIVKEEDAALIESVHPLASQLEAAVALLERAAEKIRWALDDAVDGQIRAPGTNMLRDLLNQIEGKS